MNKEQENTEGGAVSVNLINEGRPPNKHETGSIRYPSLESPKVELMGEKKYIIPDVDGENAGQFNHNDDKEFI